MTYVYDSDYRARLDVDIVENEHRDAIACAVIIDGGEGEPAVSIQLSPDKVREVRLALQRAERRFGGAAA